MVWKLFHQPNGWRNTSIINSSSRWFLFKICDSTTLNSLISFRSTFLFPGGQGRSTNFFTVKLQTGGRFEVRVPPWDCDWVREEHGLWRVWPCVGRGRSKGGTRRGPVKMTRKRKWLSSNGTYIALCTYIALGGQRYQSTSKPQTVPIYTIPKRTNTKPGENWGAIPGNLNRKQKGIQVLFSWTFLESFDSGRQSSLG